MKKFSCNNKKGEKNKIKKQFKKNKKNSKKKNNDTKKKYKIKVNLCCKRWRIGVEREMVR